MRDRSCSVQLTDDHSCGTAPWWEGWLDIISTKEAMSISVNPDVKCLQDTTSSYLSLEATGSLYWYLLRLCLIILMTCVFCTVPVLSSSTSSMTQDVTVWWGMKYLWSCWRINCRLVNHPRVAGDGTASSKIYQSDSSPLLWTDYILILSRRVYSQLLSHCKCIINNP